MTCNMKQHEGRKGGCERRHGLSEAPEVRRAKYLDSKERTVAIRPTYKSKKQLKQAMQKAKSHVTRTKFRACWV